MMKAILRESQVSPFSDRPTFNIQQKQKDTHANEEYMLSLTHNLHSTLYNVQHVKPGVMKTFMLMMLIKVDLESRF